MLSPSSLSPVRIKFCQEKKKKWIDKKKDVYCFPLIKPPNEWIIWALYQNKINFWQEINLRRNKYDLDKKKWQFIISRIKDMWSTAFASYSLT